MPELTCPHCGHSDPRRGADTAGIVDCENCDRSFAVFGRFAPSPEPTPSPVSEIPGSKDVSLAKSGGIAIAAAVVLYAALETPLGNTYLGQLLSDRGWVPYVIALFSLWSLVLLAFKLRSHRDRFELLQLDLLPRTLGERIDARNAESFRGYLRQLAAIKPDNPLIARLDWALRRLATQSEPADLAAQLSERSRLDSEVLDSSYTMLRVLIWAIPILGFIGTVLGISESVSGFSDSVNSAASLDVMRESIGSVTTGLGVAFDTTLLALVMSIVIMFPMSALQKSEEEYLTRCDDYCDVHFSSRLAGTASEPSGAIPSDRDLHSLIERLEARIDRLEPAQSER
jgi:biopolymer transport protein ExbB/TolQ